MLSLAVALVLIAGLLHPQLCNVAGDVVVVAPDVLPKPDAPGSLLWQRQDTPCVSGSPVATVEGALLLSTQDLSTSNFYCLALNATTGAVLWTYNTTFAICHVVAAHGVAYMSSAGQGIVARDISTGSFLWGCLSQFPTAPIALHKGILFTATKTKLLAVSPSTGFVLWSAKFPSTSDSGGGGGFNFTLGGDWVYAWAPTENAISCFSALNGTRVWNTTLSTHVSSLFVVDGILFVQSNALFAMNAATGANLWTATTSVFLAAYEQTLFVTESAPKSYAIQAENATNGELFWVANETVGVPLPRGAIVSSSLLVVWAGRCLTAYNEKGSLLWTHEMESREAITGGQVFGDTLFVATDTITAFELTQGTELWNSSCCTASWVGAFTVTYDSVFVTTPSNTLYALSA